MGIYSLKILVKISFNGGRENIYSNLYQIFLCESILLLRIKDLFYY